MSTVPVGISFGPFPLSPSRTQKGRIDRADFSFTTLPDVSSPVYDVLVKFYVGVDPADAFRAEIPAFQIYLSDLHKNNGVCYPGIAGGSAIIDVETALGMDAVTEAINIEGIVLTMSDAGVNNTAWFEYPPVVEEEED